jgi:hypothetical protein
VRKQSLVFKQPVSKVFPEVGSKAEGVRKKVRTLKAVGFELLPSQLPLLAANLLNAYAASKIDPNYRRVKLVAKRALGASTVTISGIE